MPNEEELSSLERVQKRLYDPKAPVAFHEPTLHPAPPSRPSGWKHLDAVREESEQMSGPARFFIVALLFFLLTGGGAVVYLVWGGRAVSPDNVNIKIQGPTTIASGDTVPLLITIENHNPVPLRNASVTVDFPNGTKSAIDPTQPLSLDTESLGDIPAGGTSQRTVRAAIFGSEQQPITIPVSLSYNTDQSTSVFAKHEQYDFVITTSPIDLTVSALSEVSSGQTVTVTAQVKSNATTPLQNVAVAATYPFGFAPSTESPKPVGSTNSLFSLGTLNPGDQRTITVTGVLTGQQNDDRVFTFTAGTQTASDSPTLATSYTSKEADIKLTSPFLATKLSVNQDTSNTPVVSAGQLVTVVVSWTNTLSTAISNAQIAVALSGSGLAPGSVHGGNGFYDSSHQTVIFSPSTNPGLANLAPGDTGQGTFTFSAISANGSPEVDLNVSVSGNRISESNVPEAVTSTLTRVVKVGTNLGLSSKIVHTTGPFANSGPWPPTPNTPTTYTVLYTLTNSGNTVAGTKVSAVLPPYVTFTGATNPADGSIVYDATSRTVTWTIGDMPSGGSKSGAFQISFTPSTTQEGTNPVLLLPQQVSGTDRFTQRPISGTQPELTTQTPSDPGYSIGDGSVK